MRVAIRKLATAILLIFTIIGGIVGCSTQTSSDSGKKTIKIGYQKYGTLNLLRTKGDLEKKLEGYKVEWILFPAGPQLLEALNTGSIDFGSTGEAPPIFAQAAGTPLVYVGAEPASPGSEGFLVPKGSPIKSIKDLKGKKVALNKGSNVHYLLVKALESAGLKLSDIQPVYLPPADARSAFEKGSVDAWVIWDPFLAAAQDATGGTLLADGKGLVSNREFYLASQSLVKNEEKVVNVIFDEIAKIGAWSKDHPEDVAKTLSPVVGIPEKTLVLAEKRRNYGIQKIDATIIADQQKIADTFYGVGLIPKAISIKDAVQK
ncbi:MAG TPA: sulfonate ABC transporter substrate-binding protein [Paenibacillaceae bacterium]|nr:sulfonate ABC transporter substrate-binding protein [Paenibacillaceae bacterium]